MVSEGFSVNSSNRLAELEVQRRQEIETENERLSAAQRHRKRLADIDAEIRQIKITEAHQAWERAKSDSAALVATNQQAIETMQRQLDEAAGQLLTVLTGVSISDVDASHHRQMAHREQAVNSIVTANAMAQGAYDDERGHMLFLTDPANFEPYVKALPISYPVRVALAEWVVRTKPNTSERKVRLAIIFALTGEDWSQLPEGADVRATFNGETAMRISDNLFGARGI